MSKVIINSAHPPGQTCLAFSRDGSRAFTGGTDAIVRVWRTDQGGDQEPETASEATTEITALAASNNCWLSGSEDGDVRRYSKNKSELEGLVTGVAGVSIRSVAVDPRGKSVAVTSDELTVKVVDLDDTLKIKILKGHTRGVRKVTWHPSGSLLTTSGSDGKIIVWDVSEDEPREEKVIEGVIPAVHDTESPEFAHDCSAVWHNSGQYFFVASRSHEIVTISRSNWAKSSTFSDGSVSGAITTLALSVNGIYLASASRSGVCIWSTQTRRLLFSHPESPEAVITQLAFSPSQNLLAWTDLDGVLTRWPDAIPPPSPDPVKPPASSVSATIQVTRKTTPSLFGEDPIDSGGHDVDLDAGLGLDNDDWIIDDVGMLDEDHDQGKRNADGFTKEMVSITKAQRPFQPGATPFDDKKRYLAYNMVGIIEVTDQDTHHIVNVEFHDRSARKGYHFTDHFKYDLGYLGERGALFACQSEGEHPAQVLYKPYGSWTSQGEWTYELPAKDLKILGICAGGIPPSESLKQNSESDLHGFGNIVIATSESDLTFVSGTGRERRIMGLGSDFVSMVAGPEWVFVVHRAGSTTIDGSQNLSYSIISFEDFTIQQAGILPIPKCHVLKWVGITAEGAPAIYDSTGRIHVLTKYRIPYHASWARILDTGLLERRQGKDESYWPVGITGSTFMCLILKGRQEHPTFPRPLIQELAITLPFRRNDVKESPLEEHIERETLLLEMARDSLAEALTTDDISRRELAMDKELIQLIQGACKNDNHPRAIELTKLLHHIASFDMAIKVAGFYHLVGLQEKIELLKADREEEEDRLVVARTKRRQWTRPDPLPRRLPVVNDSARPKPLQDFAPPPAIYRPGLARAMPVVETTRFSAAANPNGFPQSSSSTSPPPGDPPTPPDGKRKRSEFDDLSPDADDSSKRRAIHELDVMAQPPKTKVNPFAKKPAQDNGRNPFARRPDLNKPIKKSESFFDKVDAAESEKSKRPSIKGKEKQKESKQMLLPFSRPSDGVAAGRNPHKRAIETRESSAGMEIADTQATDMTLNSDSMLIGTQPNGQELHTQTVIDSQEVLSELQREEWPPSPGRESSVPLVAEVEVN